MNKTTGEEFIHFTVGMMQVLEVNGFHVRSIQEAFACLKSIVENQVHIETNKIMEECTCPNCRRTPKGGSI